MKACIMAGGKGTRLAPLTSDMPKPLAPLLGKPIVYYILDLLKKHGINEAVMSLGYQGQRLKSEMMANQYNDIDIDFAFEDTPLGTAGGVKNAMRDYKGDFIVISGDAMCDFDLSKAIEFHQLNDSMATIIAKRVNDPREYGLICSNQIGRVEGFVEKPSYKSCSTDLASTGIYILSSKVLELVNENEQVDFAKDIFPKMMENGQPIYAYEEKGYWCDIGDINSYTQCQHDIINGKVNCLIDAECLNGVYHKSKLHLENTKIKSPAFIGKGTTIGKDSVIYPNSIIGDNVTIGDNCTINGAIILDSVYVGDRATIVEAVCCNGARLENDTSIYEGSVIGSGAVVQSGAIIENGVKVWANKTVTEGTILKEDLQFGHARNITIDDDGIIGQTNVTITPALCTKIGSGVASLKSGGVIGIAYNSHQSGVALYYAVISGIVAAGANVWTFGECIESQFNFCLSKSLADYGIYIDGGIIATIKIVEKGSMPTSRPIERKLEGAINRGEYKRVSANEIGSVVNMQSLRELYAIELLKLCDAPLDGLKVNVKSSNKSIKKLMEETLIKLGCEINEGLTISISANGDGVCLSLDKQNYLLRERALVLSCLIEFLKGENVAVPQTAPKIIDDLAQIHGKTAFRYYDCPCDDKDKIARQKAIAKPYLRDGLMMTIKLLSFMKFKKINYLELLKLIPEFNVSSRLVSVGISPSVIMKRLQCDKKAQIEGAVVTKDGHTALIRPIKSGKGIMIFSESMKSETAIEICDTFESIIKDTALDS